MRQAGYTSLNDSQTLLEYDIKRASWFIDLSSYSACSGTYKTVGVSNVFTGTGTLASTDLAVNDWIIIDYHVLKVTAINSDTEIETDRAVNVDADSVAYIVTAGQEAALKTKCENEFKSLMTAYNEFLNSSDYSLTSTTTPEEKLIKAQVYRAYELYNSAAVDIHTQNKQSGIEEVEIGQVRYKYNQSAVAEATGSFSSEIIGLLEAYKVQLPTINLSRQYDDSLVAYKGVMFPDYREYEIMMDIHNGNEEKVLRLQHDKPILERLLADHPTDPSARLREITASEIITERMPGFDTSLDFLIGLNEDEYDDVFNDRSKIEHYRKVVLDRWNLVHGNVNV